MVEVPEFEPVDHRLLDVLHVAIEIRDDVVMRDATRGFSLQASGNKSHPPTGRVIQRDK